MPTDIDLQYMVGTCQIEQLILTGIDDDWLYISTHFAILGLSMNSLVLMLTIE